MIGPSAGRPANWPDRSNALTPKGADVARWTCGVMMTDDTRTDGDVGRHGDAVVNGPEDDRRLAVH